MKEACDMTQTNALQLLSSFISRTLIWASLVCLIRVSRTVSSNKAVNGGGGECVWGGSPSFHSTWDPGDNPGPAHFIECAATISTVMRVNNTYSWNPLRWLLTVCGGGLEPRLGSFLDDCKWHQSLRTLENLHISASATHLQKEPQYLPEMVKV